MSFWNWKKTIAFEVDKETMKQIDELAEHTGAESRAELFRDALRLYMWWIQKQDDGHEVLLKKDGKSVVVELKRAE